MYVHVGWGLGVWVVGDMHKEGGLCDLQWQHKDKRPPGLTCRTDTWPCDLSAHAAVKTLPPRLLLQHSVHVEQPITSMCVCLDACVYVCVHVFVHISVCPTFCLGGSRSQTKKRVKKLCSISRRNFWSEEEKLTLIPLCWALGLVLDPPWSTIRPHRHLQWPADVRE